MTTMITRRTVVALSAYLRRLELSLDRSLGEDANRLRDYCEMQIRPTPVVVGEWLSGVGRPGTATDGPSYIGRVGPPMPLGRLQLLVLGRIGLKCEQLWQIGTIVRQFADALHDALIVEPEVFVPIRLKLREASDALLKYVPDAFTRGRIERVEHRNQGPLLPTLAFDSISGGSDWLGVQQGRIE